MKSALQDLRTHLEATGGTLPRALTLDARPVHITSRWEGRTVCALFCGREREPSMVLKVDAFPLHQPRLHAEYQALSWVWRTPGMRASVPEPIALFPTGSGLVLAQSGVPGVPLSVALRRRWRSDARAAARDHAMVFGWLADLHASGRPAPPAVFDAKRMLGRLRTGLGLVADGGLEPYGSFLKVLKAEASQFAGLRIPVLPGHGDLAPSNCQISGDDVAVVDWEGGVGPREPLADLVVFLNHYARAAPLPGQRLPTPAGAFERAFLGDGWLARLTATSFCEQLSRHGLPAEAGHVLFVSTLGDLATGTAPTAHARRLTNRRYWAESLARYATSGTRFPSLPSARPALTRGGSIRAGQARARRAGGRLATTSVGGPT